MLEIMYVLCPLLLLSIHSLLKRQKTVQLHEAKTAEITEKPGKSSPYTQRRKTGNPVRVRNQDQRTSCTINPLELPECSKRAQVRDWRKCVHRNSRVDADEQMVRNKLFCCNSLRSNSAFLGSMMIIVYTY